MPESACCTPVVPGTILSPASSALHCPIVRPAVDSGVMFATESVVIEQAAETNELVPLELATVTLPGWCCVVGPAYEDIGGQGGDPLSGKTGRGM